MKIAILARNANLYSHKRLVEAGKARGHEVRIINTLNCYMNISAQNAEIYYRGGEVISGFDAVIPRIGSSITFYGTAVVRQFEMMGVYTLNEATAISRSRDKLRSLQLLSRKGINMPITGFAHSNSDTQDLIDMVGGAPLIVKLLEGTQGMGVVLAETTPAAESVINAFKNLNADILVQEFIQEAGGMDIRCFVIGNKVVGTIKRQAKDGEFRSNLHRGGTADIVTITEEERAMAIRASQILRLNVAGVDIIRSKRGPMVIEVNSSPGLKGIELATKLDIASKIIEFVEQSSKKGKKLLQKPKKKK
jgi:ribosomal protein S6--L-glutamate ligase